MAGITCQRSHDDAAWFQLNSLISAYVSHFIKLFVAKHATAHLYLSVQSNCLFVRIWKEKSSSLDLLFICCKKDVKNKRNTEVFL